LLEHRQRRDTTLPRGSKVPWAKLGQEPVVAEFDRLYIVACPREDSSSQAVVPEDQDDGTDDTARHAAELELQAKRRRIDGAEEAWLKVWQQLCGWCVGSRAATEP
jgi:vacuolar protein sorting-associated protein 13A/C